MKSKRGKSLTVTTEIQGSFIWVFRVGDYNGVGSFILLCGLNYLKSYESAQKYDQQAHLHSVNNVIPSKYLLKTVLKIMEKTEKVAVLLIWIYSLKHV